MFETVLFVLSYASLIVPPASCAVGVVWWKRTSDQVGWRWGMSRVGVVLMWCGLLLSIAFVIASAAGFGPVFGDPTRYAMWALSGFAMALITLVSAILGRTWLRAVLLVDALAIAFLGLMVAESF